MTPIRFGIIGCSSVARRRFIPALRATPSARLEHIGSRDPQKAGRLAGDSGCAKSGTYEEVLNDPQVDAVYISTPPALHEPWVRKAAEHRKHILCEKPAFPDRRVADEMVALCRRQGVRLMEGYMFRYHPQHAIIRSLIENGRIGEPRFFHGQFTFPQPDENNSRLQRDLGGGVFLDAAGYPVAAAMLLFDALPVSVHCQVEMDAAAGVDNAVSMMLRFPGKRTAQIFAGYGLHYRSRYSVLGTQGRIETSLAFAVPPEKAPEIILETGSGHETISVPPADQFRLMIEDFCAQVGGGADRSKTFETTLLRQHAVMDAAWRAHLDQKSVSISEA